MTNGMRTEESPDATHYQIFADLLKEQEGLEQKLSLKNSSGMNQPAIIGNGRAWVVKNTNNKWASVDITTIENDLNIMGISLSDSEFSDLYHALQADAAYLNDNSMPPPDYNAVNSFLSVSADQAEKLVLAMAPAVETGLISKIATNLGISKADAAALYNNNLNEAQKAVMMSLAYQSGTGANSFRLFPCSGVTMSVALGAAKGLRLV